MDNTTKEWVTVAQAAEITERPTNTITNWYLYDKTVRHMRLSARRVLVHLGDCIEQNRIRSRRRRKPAPVVVAAPAVNVEVVPFSLAGQQCQGWRIDGEELLDAGLLGRLLDYAGKGLVNTIAGAWSDEFIDGEHFRVIDGPALEVLKVQPVENNSTGSVPKHSSSIMTLTRAGVALVLLKTRKPIGVALRRALSGAHFMRELLDGNPEPMRQAVAGPATDMSPVMHMMAQMMQHQQRSQERQDERFEKLLLTVTQAVQGISTRPTEHQVIINVGDQPQYVEDPAACMFTKEKVLSIINKEFPAVEKWQQISKPARRAGIFCGDTNTGTEGMAEYRMLKGADWPKLFLSWAFLEWARSHMTSMGLIRFE